MTVPADLPTEDARVEEIAEAFHGHYELLAPSFGYKTRDESAVPWEQVPEQNRKLMIAVVERLIETGVIVPAADAEHQRYLAEQNRLDLRTTAEEKHRLEAEVEQLAEALRKIAGQAIKMPPARRDWGKSVARQALARYEGTTDG